MNRKYRPHNVPRPLTSDWVCVLLSNRLCQQTDERVWLSTTIYLPPHLHCHHRTAPYINSTSANFHLDHLSKWLHNFLIVTRTLNNFRFYLCPYPMGYGIYKYNVRAYTIYVWGVAGACHHLCQRLRLSDPVIWPNTDAHWGLYRYNDIDGRLLLWLSARQSSPTLNTSGRFAIWTQVTQIVDTAVSLSGYNKNELRFTVSYLKLTSNLLVAFNIL